jgi:hypothetical protein
MSFKLNLGFGGLCLFVPELRGGKPDKMHVLLPADPDHTALLAYDPNATDSPAPPGVPEQLPFGNCQLDLTRLQAVPGLTGPPEGVADLDGACSPVPREMIKPSYTGTKIRARVSFAAGASRIHDCAAGGFWNYRQPRAQQLALRVVWQLTVEDSKLEVAIASLRDSTTVKTLSLHPHNGKLDLWVFNLAHGETLRELPPRTRKERPDPGTRAHHFGVYFTLLGGCTVAVPTFERSEIDPTRPPPPCYDDTPSGLNAMCIAATAPLAP